MAATEQTATTTLPPQEADVPRNRYPTSGPEIVGFRLQREPLFDADRLTATALRVLDDPLAFRALGMAARRRIEERYSLEVAVPKLKAYFERAASRTRPLDRRMRLPEMVPNT